MPALAWTLNELASLYMSTGRTKEAEALYTEALQLRRQLFKSNPDAYMPVLADTLQAMATLYLQTERSAQARVLYTESLEYYRMLERLHGSLYAQKLQSVSVKSVHEIHRR